MALGFSIFILAVGAILTFAVDARVAGVDLDVVGWILMGAGVLGLLVSLLVLAPRRRRDDVAASGIAYQAVAPVAQPTVVQQRTPDEP